MGIRNMAALLPGAAALLLAGCGGPKPIALPGEPIDRAATCGVITAIAEREQAGAKGDLPADAQARIFHYPLLAASTGDRFDRARADAVFKRMPQLSEQTTEGKWQPLRPACRAAFPQAAIAAPRLPDAAAEARVQCFVLADFLRKAFGDLPGAYGEAATRYGALTNRLDAKVAATLGPSGDTQKRRRDEALAAAAKLGQPPAVIAACEKRFG